MTVTFVARAAFDRDALIVGEGARPIESDQASAMPNLVGYISEPANGSSVASRAGTRSAGRTDGERTCEKRKAETLHQASEC